MPALRILIVYGTHHGQTALIAQRIAELLRESGSTATVVNGHNPPRDVDPASFDGVIVGGSIQYNRHQRFLRDYVRSHRDALNAMPSAFFSVSGAGAGRSPEQRAKATGYVADFLRDTGWHPAATAAIGGAMAYTKYNPFLRWMLKRIAAREGAPTDTSRDHSFTDWAQVEQFATAFAATIAQAIRQQPAPTVVHREESGHA